MLVCGIGLLFGYTLTHIVVRLLYTQSNARLHYFVPAAPHTHGEMDGYVPAFTGVKQWHDFDEGSHLSMCTFYMHTYIGSLPCGSSKKEFSSEEIQSNPIQ